MTTISVPKTANHLTELKDTNSERAALALEGFRSRSAPRGLPPAKARNASSKRILVVDDDFMLLRLVTRLMEHAGFATGEAHDGEEGWEALCGADYDLVITDNEMPRLNGVSMIMRLRAVSASLPCLLISGSFDGMESVLNRCISPGAVLAKPFTPTALLETVAGLLRIGAMDGA